MCRMLITVKGASLHRDAKESRDEHIHPAASPACPAPGQLRRTVFGNLLRSVKPERNGTRRLTAEEPRTPSRMDSHLQLRSKLPRLAEAEPEGIGPTAASGSLRLHGSTALC